MCLNLYSHSGYDAAYLSQAKNMQTDGDLWWQKRDKADNKSPPLVKFHWQTAEISVQIYAEHNKPHIMIQARPVVNKNTEVIRIISI